MDQDRLSCLRAGLLEEGAVRGSIGDTKGCPLTEGDPRRQWLSLKFLAQHLLGIGPGE